MRSVCLCASACPVCVPAPPGVFLPGFIIHMNVRRSAVHLFGVIQTPSENASRAMETMDEAKPLVFNGDEYSLSVSKAGKNKSGSQKYCILLHSTSSASRRQVYTSVDRSLLTRVVAAATSTAAQRSFRGRAPYPFAKSSSLLHALKRTIDDTRQELSRERPQSSTDPSQLQQARVAHRPLPPPPP